MPSDEDVKEREGSKKQKKKSSLLLIVVILIVVLAAAGGAYYFLVLKKSTNTEVDAASNSAPQTAVPKSGTEPGPIYSYPPFIVNLMDPGGNRYLKVTLSLELSKEKNFPLEVEAKDPKIKDIIISILSSKSYDEISTSQGKIALKQEIIRRLNTIMSGGRIVDVYITEFMVQ